MPHARLPAPIGPSPWDAVAPELPPGGEAPVAVGGDLSPATMVGAYRRGVFPWPAMDPATAAEIRGHFAGDVAAGRIPVLGGRRAARQARRASRPGRRSPGRSDALDLPWWSPDPRAVVPAGGMHISGTLRARLRTCGWTATLDRAFAEVVRGCARGGPHAWITPDLAAAYQRLHDLGWAHSTEVWRDGELVGGHFGLLVGGVYAAESMFHRHTDASKAALVDFDDRFTAAGGRLVDVQLASSHLRTMGAYEIPRTEFLATLTEVRDLPVTLVTDPLPVARLATRRS
jgi:leucyl/phenylalanyl-tRNA---protein transferase